VALTISVFMLQGPLCAFACISSGADPEAPAIAAEAAPPCHESAPSPSSSEPIDSNENCGCEESGSAFLAKAEDTASSLERVEFLSRAIVFEASVAGANSAASPRPGHLDLPPPDILLLKATLLI
jgi:hypothetical protein